MPITDDVINSVEPISDEDLAKLKQQAVARWKDKPWFDGFGPMGSPGFVLRTHEVLSLIARIEKEEN